MFVQKVSQTRVACSLHFFKYMQNLGPSFLSTHLHTDILVNDSYRSAMVRVLKRELCKSGLDFVTDKPV